MRKEFISFDTIRNNALLLAAQILKQGFSPDIIYTSLRGGAPMANIMSEYFSIKSGAEGPLYAAVVARSYTGVASREDVRIEGWTLRPEEIKMGSKVLFVDDIFDSGKTINRLIPQLIERGPLQKEDLKIAVHDYKIFSYKKEQPVKPDFYCRKHIIASPGEDFWIHYLSHELEGLTEQEKEDQYFKLYPELREVL